MSENRDDNRTTLDERHNRYDRQTRFAPLGIEGQRRLSNARVVIVGMGALGAVIAQHLVRSGVGFLRIIDRDVLEWTNLQRQMLYTEQDVIQALPKALAAAAHLQAINSQIVIEPVVADVTASNAEALLTDVDLILDGSDNFTVRYLMNDISLKHRIPWIYGGASGASGMTMTFIPEQTACFRCLFPSPPPSGAIDTCDTAGVISPAVDIVASLQVTEALKWLSGNLDALHSTLMRFDLWQHQWMPIQTAHYRQANCESCQHRHYPTLTDNHAANWVDAPASDTAAVTLCGRNTVQISPPMPLAISLQELASNSAVSKELTPYLLRFYCDNNITMLLFPDGRALFQGTEDQALAQRLYTQLLNTQRTNDP